MQPLLTDLTMNTHSDTQQLCYPQLASVAFTLQAVFMVSNEV